MNRRFYIILIAVFLSLIAVSCNMQPICAVYATTDDVEHLKETG